MNKSTTHNTLPERFERPHPLSAVAFCFVLAFFFWSLNGAEISISDLLAGFPNMAQIGNEMVPPNVSRFWPMADAVLVTFQMALVGTVIGVLISIPMGVLAAKNLSPHPIIYRSIRALITFFRTVPDIVWALFFVASVGLGPFAGTLALIIDTVGFCARFFAEDMEEVDPGPSEALSTIGGRRLDIVVCSVFPAAMPGMVNTSLFALEKAVRSSVVLGVVGAGGIGAELTVAMDMFQYDLATTIISMIFVLVVGVEWLSSIGRARLLGHQK